MIDNMPFLFTFDSSFSSDTSIATLELNSFKISNLSFLSHCFTSNYSRWVFPLFLPWFFSSMGLWLICFRCVYPCFIGFPCASFFFFTTFLFLDSQFQFNFLIIWYFMALICFENPIIHVAKLSSHSHLDHANHVIDKMPHSLLH